MSVKILKCHTEAYTFQDWVISLDIFVYHHSTYGSRKQRNPPKIKCPSGKCRLLGKLGDKHCVVSAIKSNSRKLYCSLCIREKPSSVGAIASMKAEGERYLGTVSTTQIANAAPLQASDIYKGAICAFHVPMYLLLKLQSHSLLPIVRLLSETLKSPSPSRQLIFCRLYR